MKITVTAITVPLFEMTRLSKALHFKQRCEIMNITVALWSITAKNTDWSTGPLARPFARSLAPLTGLLCTTCFARALRCAHSLTHFANFQARGTVID